MSVNIGTRPDRNVQRRLLAESIIRLRKQNDWTQEGLANKCHWAEPSRISNYENLKRTPQLDDLVLMADAFDISLDELVQRKRAYEQFSTKVPYLGDWQEIPRFFRTPRLHKQTMIPVTVGSFPGEGSFALTVEDESMAPVFSGGDIVIVDAKRTPASLDFVVIKNKTSIVLRQLVMKNKKTLIESCDEVKKAVELSPSHTIYGVVVSRIKSFSQDYYK